MKESCQEARIFRQDLDQWLQFSVGGSHTRQIAMTFVHVTCYGFLCKQLKDDGNTDIIQICARVIAVPEYRFGGMVEWKLLPEFDYGFFTSCI